MFLNRVFFSKILFFILFLKKNTHTQLDFVVSDVGSALLTIHYSIASELDGVDGLLKTTQNFYCFRKDSIENE